MQWQINVTPILFGLLILALLGALIGFIAPEILKVTDLQNQISLQEVRSRAQIAEQQARIAAAPTITYIDTQIKQAQLLSVTQQLEQEKARAQIQIETAKKQAEAEYQAALKRADGEAQRNQLVGMGIMIMSVLLVSGGVVAFLHYGFRKYNSQKLLAAIDSKRLDYEQEEKRSQWEIRRKEIEVVAKAVDLMASNGGRIALESGRVLEFTPKLAIPSHLVNRADGSCLIKEQN